MEGRAEAAKIRADDATLLAWRTALFTRTDKRLNLPDFLICKRQRKAQTPDEMLTVFRTLAEMGSPMNIRRVN